MGRSINLFILFFTILLYTFSAAAQTTDTVETEAAEPNDCWNGSIGIPSAVEGISLGNSRQFKGLRLNFSDCGIDKIDGVNVTLMWPLENPNSEINGIALGLVGPGAARITGIAVAGIGMQATESITGFSFSTFASSSEGEMTGVQIGGLALISKGRMLGINAAAFGIDGYSEVNGFSVGGVGLVSSKGMNGINIGGFATLSEGNITGLNIAGFALYSFNELSGLNIAGTITSYNTTGVSASLYHNSENRMKGISFSLFNYAAELLGVQIGIINIAMNNPFPFKVMPLINMNFNKQN